MTPIDDLGQLAQFKALAETLPDIRFDTAGTLHPRIALFAATGSDAEVDLMMARVADLPFDGDLAAAVSQADADLRLYELALGSPSTALGAADAARTIAYGMTAIEPGPDLFALAALGKGDTIFVADPLETLANFCGRDVCAILGAIMASRMAGLPAIIDGAAALNAARILQALNPTALTHCAVPMGSVIENDARALGLHSIRCNDARPLYALADAIVHAKSPYDQIIVISQ